MRKPSSHRTPTKAATTAAVAGYYVGPQLVALTALSLRKSHSSFGDNLPTREPYSSREKHAEFAAKLVRTN